MRKFNKLMTLLIVLTLILSTASMSFGQGISESDIKTGFYIKDAEGNNIFVDIYTYLNNKGEYLPIINKGLENVLFVNQDKKGTTLKEFLDEADFRKLELDDFEESYKDAGTDKELKPQDFYYRILASLDKKEYYLDDEITLTGKALKLDDGLSGINITVKIEDEDGDLVNVGQFETDDNGKFEHTFQVPAGLEAGTYSLTVKAHDPVEKVEKSVELDLVLVERDIIEWADEIITTIAKNEETNHPPYQLMQINYKRNKVADKIQLTIKDKDLEKIYLETEGATDVRDDGFFQWSYRDLSTLGEEGVTLPDLERNNEYKLDVGTNLIIEITATKSEEEFVLTYEYAITQEDYDNSMWEEPEEPVDEIPAEIINKIATKIKDVFENIDEADKGSIIDAKNKISTITSEDWNIVLEYILTAELIAKFDDPAEAEAKLQAAIKELAEISYSVDTVDLETSLMTYAETHLPTFRAIFGNEESAETIFGLIKDIILNIPNAITATQGNALVGATDEDLIVIIEEVAKTTINYTLDNGYEVFRGKLAEVGLSVDILLGVREKLANIIDLDNAAQIALINAYARSESSITGPETITETATYTLEVLGQDVSTLVNWSSSDEDIATIDVDEVVELTAVTDGVVTITVYRGSDKGNWIAKFDVEVTVEP